VTCVNCQKVINQTTLISVPDIASPDLMWLTGLFEGEGTITTLGQQGTWTLAVSMSDRDVIDRFHQLIGRGSVTVVPRRNQRKRVDGSDRKTMYQWRLCGKQAVLVSLCQMLPHLGERRATKAREAIRYIEVSMTRCRKHAEEFLRRREIV
jgi:hypothetical protein